MTAIPPAPSVSSRDELFSHLMQIRSALWRNSSAGRASVMVGAGFSRQAESLALAGARLPLWSQLRDRLAELLRLPPDDVTPVMEVAQRFQERFGRPALDDAISEFVPDAAFGPGQAHRRLLALPWADVLTTNYDTLLERAAVTTIERRYENILVAEDLPKRASPRIVKLHGTLPSHRPFIISTQDYANYPARHAPFVNLVRQSAMETILVLIGFSGRDPNFEGWMRWVQDELREHALPIYLCGVLELTEEERLAFAARRIVPLNLGELFPKSDFPQRDERHAAATAWLLDVLQDGKPSRPGEWAPDSAPVARALHPPGPAAFKFTVGSELRPMPGTEATTEQLADLAKTWRAQRLEYPGWIVAPNPPRWRIWHGTERWRGPILRACSTLAPEDQFRLLREMVWRLDLCLASLWTTEAEHIARLLERVNPFPGIFEMPEAEPCLRGVSETDLAEGWIELAFAVLRVSREDLDPTVFQLWASRLERLLPVWPQLGPRLWAEQVFWAQAQLDLDLLDARLKHWEANDRSLAGRAKIAAIKGELGRSEAAHRQASEVLQELRGKLGALQSPLPLMSLEAWLINLVEVLKEKPWSRLPEVRERLSELRHADCDPDEIINDLKRSLRDFQLPVSERTDGPDFDPGYVDEPAHHAEPDTSDMLPAFRALRLVEVAPCAWHSQRFAFLSREAAAAAVWLQTTAPFWALSAIVRTNDKTALSHYMDRASVLKLPPDQVERIWVILHRLASQVLSRIPDDFRKASDDSACQMGAMALELLSRLAFRLKQTQLEELVNLLVRWLHSERACNAWVFDDAMGSLINRLLFALPKELLPDVAMRLLASPVKEARGLSEMSRGHWPEVGHYLDEITDWPQTAVTLPAGLFDRLLHHVRSEDQEGRPRAAFRLLFLSERKWLSPAELETCAVGIWSQLDAGCGIPRNLGLTSFGLSKLPGAEERGLSARYRTQMESGEFEPLATSDGRSMRTGVIGDVRSSVRNIRRAYGYFYAHPPKYQLSRDAALRILTGIIAWWEKNVAVLREVAAGKRGSFIFSPTSAHLLAHDFAAVVGECVLPVLKDDAAAHEQALTWLRGVERDGFDPSLAWIGLLAVGKMEAATVADGVSRLVLAATRMEINDGSWLITSWYRAHRAGVLAGPPPWLVDLLAYRVVWRAEPALGLSCDWLAQFIREWGEVISTTALSLLLQSLEVLLQTTDFESHWQNQSSETATRKEAHRMMDVRTSATGVASALYRAAKLRGGEPHPVLVKWAELAADHTLPEIRRAWRARD